MATKVDLYNSAYGSYEADVYRRIRTATYGQDFGQTSWVMTEESRKIPRLLDLSSSSTVLEIGSGSGRYALHLVETIGCHVLGLDVNEFGVENANRLSAEAGVADRVRFQTCDVSKPLPFEDACFDAAFSNDVICHIPERLQLLRELCRVLKPGGKLLFSDALIIGGTISHQEIAARSSIGYYIFSPPGENERLLVEAGFSVLSATDTTVNAAEISARWCEARDNSKDQLLAIEGESNFQGLQQFLSCVHQLTRERRLLRYLYVAHKASA
jgi:ubiquinone/menaquinone biosynthesis C-methylase UbiE